MTLAAAQTAAGQLRVALLDHGVRAVSIELQPGVGPKADPWGVAPFVRGMGHHIVSRPPGTPGLALVKTGRTGANALQGPLCNGYGGFDLVARIITMGWANHPGEGGPWAVPGWGAVPRNDGRPRIFGWEFEGGLEPYTDEMHDFMARCGAGTLDWLGVLNHREPAPLECWGEHKDPWAPGRKVDRLGYTATSGRARIAAVRTADPQGDFMSALSDDEQRELLKGVRELTKVRELRRAGVPAGVGTIGEIAAGLDVALNSVLDVSKADLGANIAVRDHIVATRRELRALVVQVEKLVEALGSADRL